MVPARSRCTSFHFLSVHSFMYLFYFKGRERDLLWLSPQMQQAHLGQAEASSQESTGSPRGWQGLKCSNHKETKLESEQPGVKAAL